MIFALQVWTMNAVKNFNSLMQQLHFQFLKKKVQTVVKVYCRIQQLQFYAYDFFSRRSEISY